MHFLQSLPLLGALVGTAAAQYDIKPTYQNAFQVHSQFAPSGGGGQCGSTQAIQYSFSNSYGSPASNTFSPPSCPGGSNFTQVSFTLQNVAKGTQYDRLMIFSLGDNEVWRSSTFEPLPDGTYSTYTKDMTPFSSLLRTSNIAILQIDNVVDASIGIIGVFNVTVTATYYYGTTPATRPADAVFPITNKLGSQGKTSYFTLRSGDIGTATFANLPRKGVKAIVTIIASGGTFGDGNSDEFWWANSSPFREVQLTIDSRLAGSYFPFPQVYTGGVNPSYWRPVVGINAYDAYAHSIDVTPYLNSLCNGKSHSFKLSVLGGGSGWFVSGNLHFWTGTAQAVVTSFTWDSGLSVSSDNTTATRYFRTSGILNGQNYSTSQDLSYSWSRANSYITQSTNGTDIVNGVANIYSWPIRYEAAYVNGQSQNILTTGFNLGSLGIRAQSTARAVTSGNVGYASTTETYTDGTGYSRTVTGTNGVLTRDTNPSLKHRRQSRADRRQITSGSIEAFLAKLLAGPLGQFLEGRLPVSQSSLNAILVVLNALKAFDPNVAPKRVQFAPPTRLTQGDPFYVGN